MGRVVRTEMGRENRSGIVRTVVVRFPSGKEVPAT